MAKEPHIILRRSSSTSDIFLGPSPMSTSRDMMADGLSVEVDSIDRKNIPALVRDRDVVAVAPSIPVRLIEPAALNVLAGPSANGSTWGVTAVGADTSRFTGNGVTVAILDTGIDSTHPAFAGVTIVEEDFTGSGNGDTQGHGTHCAGTVFGRDVNGTRIGVARGVSKALIGKVLGPGGGASEQIVRAIQWAVEGGASVISMSLGIDFPGYVASLVNSGWPAEQATSYALEGYRANVQLFERLAGLVRTMGMFSGGAIIVAAAGNESMRGGNPTFEIAVSPPAVAEGVISVAAVGQQGGGFGIAPFSNTGANIAGPGVGILSAGLGGGLASMSGTSMATPHVAGVAALWAERIRSDGALVTPQLLTARLVGSALNSVMGNEDPSDYGAGMVQAPQ
jgi:subtilisin family serine protease